MTTRGERTLKGSRKAGRPEFGKARVCDGPEEGGTVALALSLGEATGLDINGRRGRRGRRVSGTPGRKDSGLEVGLSFFWWFVRAGEKEG